MELFYSLSERSYLRHSSHNESNCKHYWFLVIIKIEEILVIIVNVKSEEQAANKSSKHGRNRRMLRVYKNHL